MEDTQVGQELIEMGRVRGEVSSRREDILEVLFVRFGKASPDMLSLLARLEDPEQARELLRLALRADSLAAFTTRLREVLD